MIRSFQMGVVAAAFTTAAQAGMITGTTVEMPGSLGAANHALVGIGFVSQSAGATGSLYLLGWEDSSGKHYTPDSDANGLGDFLFSNHNSAVGSWDVLGVFEEGATLHFAYLVTSGVNMAPTGQVTRTDNAGQIQWFATEDMGGQQVRLYVEDIIGPGSDYDYNDAVFDVHYLPIPAPGSTALAGAGLVMVSSRRRDKRN